MAGQVMEAHHQARLQPSAMPQLAPVPLGCKNDVHHHHHLIAATATTTVAAMATSGGSNAATTSVAAASDMAAYLQHLQDTAAAAAEASNKQSGNGGVGGGVAARGEQCPRCASHDTKFCYYNNYNTSQPRHFCRACRRYWTLGGSLRNVPIGGSTRKRPRLAHHHHQPPAARRAPVFGLGLGLGGGTAPMPPVPSSSLSQGGLLGSLFALGGGAAPLLEGRGAGSFDLGLGLPSGPFGGGGGGELGVQNQMQGLGLRGSGSGAASSFLWPAGLLDSDSVDAWKMLPGAGGVGAAMSMWPDFSAAAVASQTGGLLHGGAQLM